MTELRIGSMSIARQLFDLKVPLLRQRDEANGHRIFVFDNSPGYRAKIISVLGRAYVKSC